MFIVTGTPRAATGYASLLFSEVQVPCTHERVFRPRATLHEVLDWYNRGGDKGESSWLAWAFLGVLPGPVHVLHTVRDPWAVIDSLAHRNDVLPSDANITPAKKLFRDVVKFYCPAIFRHTNTIDRAAEMVLAWNARIEEAAKFYGVPYRRYRVETVDNVGLTATLQWLGIYRDAVEVARALETVPLNVNGGKKLDYNVEVKHPLVRAYLEETHPGVEPVLSCVVSCDTKRSAAELSTMMLPRLREAIQALAERYGYK